MPVCPKCEYEYIEGITFCPDCGAALLDYDQYIKPEEWDEQNWEIIYIGSDVIEVEMIKNNLESGEIKAVVLSQKDRNYPAPGAFSVVKLLVRKEDVQDAVTFIQKVKSEKIENEETEDNE